MSTASPSKPAKPLWHRPWVWVVAVLAVLWVIGAVDRGNNPAPAPAAASSTVPAAKTVALTATDTQACNVAAVPLMHVYQTAAIPTLGAWSAGQQDEMAAAIDAYVQLSGNATAPVIDPLESKLAAQWIAVSVAIRGGDNRPLEADGDLWTDLKALGDACGVQP